MGRVLIINSENCTGCRLCELACSSSKNGEISPTRSRVKVIADTLKGRSWPAVCLQCDDPMCMAVCPVNAISKTHTAQGDPLVAVDMNKCIGCQRCSAACPFGAIAFFPELKATKCDLCEGTPKCVEFCFYECLRFVELSDEEYAKRKRKIKALTTKACREISRQEPTRRRAEFSLEASRVSRATVP
jgi:carbon-monoxide dehydrogenase iron sulfur subunit